MLSAVEGSAFEAANGPFFSPFELSTDAVRWKIICKSPAGDRLDHVCLKLVTAAAGSGLTRSDAVVAGAMLASVPRVVPERVRSGLLEALQPIAGSKTDYAVKACAAHLGIPVSSSSEALNWIKGTILQSAGLGFFARRATGELLKRYAFGPEALNLRAVKLEIRRFGCVPRELAPADDAPVPWAVLVDPFGREVYRPKFKDPALYKEAPAVPLVAELLPADLVVPEEG